MAEVTKKCLAKVEEYKIGLQNAISKTKISAEIAGLLYEAEVTLALTEREINEPLEMYLAIINTSDAALERAEQSGGNPDPGQRQESIRVQPGS